MEKGGGVPNGSFLAPTSLVSVLFSGELRNIYHHHPDSKRRKSSEANSGSIHPYGRYENAVKTRKTISTTAILWPVNAIFREEGSYGGGRYFNFPCFLPLPAMVSPPQTWFVEHCQYASVISLFSCSLLWMDMPAHCKQHCPGEAHPPRRCEGGLAAKVLQGHVYVIKIPCTPPECPQRGV